MLEAIGIGIVVLIWVVSSLIKGFKWLLRQTNPPPPPQALPPSQAGFPPQAPFQNRAPAQFSSPPSSQAAFQAPPPSRPAPVQAIPQQAARAEQARAMPRQPQAGGPAVLIETNRRDFERQEQDLLASEPAGLGVSLTSPSARPDTSPNRLFGGTDDLVRAIILQEVLGPPLSRRKSASAPPHAAE